MLPMRVIVVGGGVLGAMHALWAHDLGHEVVHLEREAAARGASVRNFGLVWVGGRATGRELQLAQLARDLWSQVADQIPAVGLAAARGRGPPTVVGLAAALGPATSVVEPPGTKSPGCRDRPHPFCSLAF